jgi:hypothetical protein
VERRSRTTKKHRPRSVRRPSAPLLSTPWPTIEAFFESGEGDISIGAIHHAPMLRYTAVAADEHTMLVALVRRERETLHQLLDRLENALGPAIEAQEFVDEINGPATPPTKSRRP